MYPFRFGLKILSIALLVSVFTLPTLAVERVKTDGKTKDSPIKVVKLDFLDSGYGMPGPNAEVRLSTVVQNGSKDDDLKNVVIHLQLKQLDGSVVQEWTKSIPVMKKGATVEFDPGAVYYNFSFNNLSAGVMVEHDKVEKPADDKAKQVTK